MTTSALRFYFRLRRLGVSPGYAWRVAMRSDLRERVQGASHV